MNPTSQRHLDAIVSDLPDWPDDLRTLWISPEADIKGWPPVEGSDWRYAIGPQRTLGYLQRINWVRMPLRLVPDMIAPSSLQLLVDMFRGYYYGDPGAGYFAKFDGGRERFDGLVQFLCRESRFPWPPALERAADGLHILDGHHRVLALLYLSGFLKAREGDLLPTYDDYQLDFWISERPSSER